MKLTNEQLRKLIEKEKNSQNEMSERKMLLKQLNVLRARKKNPNLAKAVDVAGKFGEKLTRAGTKFVKKVQENSKNQKRKNTPMKTRIKPKIRKVKRKPRVLQVQPQRTKLQTLADNNFELF